MKVKIPSEIIYIVSLTLVALAVALLTSSDLGLSMVVAPAYLVSLKLDFLSFGTAEYVVQAIVFLIFCIIMRKIRPIFFTAFLSALLYGAILDLWRLLPLFDPAVTPVGSMAMPQRIALFASGMLLMCFSVALSFRTYLYPQVYDFFVKGISAHFKLNRTRFKQCFDASCLLVSCILTLALFRRFVGIGAGTLVITLCNGFLIGIFSDFFDKHLKAEALFPRFAACFDLEG